MVATRRRAQLVTAPVIYHIVPMTIFDRQAFAPAEIMIGACATFIAARIVVRAPLVFMALLLASLVAMAFLLVLGLLIASVLIAIPATLGKGNSSRGHR